ncbi:hypothetical protein C2G38_2159789 [Gigaspora rosea]|uniref:Uncharacterized protein n=1 Tax=Gigaspora rosea TaxID=44941 RepID=A0A397W0J3_9GLOM|nr:hypothetical protein C2G38_2159789 [Gigaspora rosea]
MAAHGVVAGAVVGVVIGAVKGVVIGAESSLELLLELIAFVDFILVGRFRQRHPWCFDYGEFRRLLLWCFAFGVIYFAFLAFIARILLSSEERKTYKTNVSYTSIVCKDREDNMIRVRVRIDDKIG